MAFKIPPKAFLSFGRKQCLDTLWRIGLQLDQHWENEQQRVPALEGLASYLAIVQTHEDSYLVDLAQKLEKIELADPKLLQQWLMFIERELGKDLKDSDFLISTEDQFDLEEVKTCPIHLVLDNLRSSFNVGSLFRTAEAMGVNTIHMCGYTPTPENSKTAKSALGADQWVKWKYWESTLECLENLKSESVKIYSLETEASAINISEFNPQFPCALVLGNERYGLGPSVLKQSDALLKIPLSGKKNSLNVGSCGAMALYAMVTSLEKQN